MRRNIAAILGAGIGSRTGLDSPKQFLKIAGRMVMEHTVDVFQEHPAIDEIAIVVNPSYVGLVQSLVLKNRWNKVKKILQGGEKRYQSSLAAIRAYRSEPQSRIILHDAVRPLVTDRILNDVIAALEGYDAVDTAIPAADTIIQVDWNQRIVAVPDREFLRRGQTPQAFTIGTLLRAYETGLNDPHFKATDDCGVVATYLPETPIVVVNGDETNMKLTYLQDAFLLDRLFQLRTRTISTASTPDMRGKVVVVFGGSSGIGKEIVKMCTENGARAYAFSRSLNGVDVGTRAAVRNALQDTFSKEGRIDYVVNCAAVMFTEPLVDMSEEDVNEIISTNYTGVVNTSVCSFDYLRQSRGQLLHFTSSSYTRGRAFYSLYSSTKAAVVNFVQALAQEWEPFSIRVNCINPERTKTPLRERNFGNEPEETLLKPEEVSAVAVQTLLSAFTGQIVDVRRHHNGSD